MKHHHYLGTFLMFIAVILFISFVALYEQGTDYTGLSVGTRVVTDELMQSIDSRTTIPLVFEQQPTSIHVQGRVLGDGDAEIWLQTANASILVATTRTIQEEDRVTGLVIDNHPIQNVTADQHNDSIRTNESESFNGTKEETLTQENTTVSRDTDHFNETPNDAPLTEKAISAMLSYRGASQWDTFDNGIEPRGNIIDVTVQGTTFTFDADASKVCTRWTIENSDDDVHQACTGSPACCAFVGLEKEEGLAWHELYLYDGLYGADDHSMVTAQVIYYDVNLNLSDLRTDIVYSSVVMLPVRWTDAVHTWDDACTDACSLAFDVNEAQLLVMVSGEAVVELESVSYVVKKTHPITYVGPIKIMLDADENYTAELASWFIHPDGRSLLINVEDDVNLNVTYNTETLTIVPDSDFSGEREIVVVASDGARVKRQRVPVIVEAVSGQNATPFIQFRNKAGEFAHAAHAKNGNIKLNAVRTQTRQRHQQPELLGQAARVEENVTNSIIVRGARSAPGTQITGYLDAIDVTEQTGHGKKIVTDVVALPSFDFDNATIALEKNGNVNTLLECPQFNFTDNSCPVWRKSSMPYTENSTHIVFTVDHFSGYAGAEIEVINVQSYPSVGGEWSVRFTTEGTANLTIIPYDGTTFTEHPDDNNETSDDLEFLELVCGEEEVEVEHITVNDTHALFVKDYACALNSTETSHVITPGKHYLQFMFGDDVDYARNTATLTECQAISSPGDYQVTNDVNSSGDCFVVSTGDIEIDCLGNTITYGNDTDGYGITFGTGTAYDNVTIKNCNIFKGDGGGGLNRGIVGKFTKSRIFNNNVTTKGTSNNYGVQLWEGNNITFANNTIATNGSSSANYGLQITSTNVTVTGNVISTHGSSGNDGIVASALDINITNNDVYTYGVSSGASNDAVYVSSGEYDVLIKNNRFYPKGSGSGDAGISLDGTARVIANNITALEDFEYGIYITSDGNNISYNRVITDGDYGIRLSGSYNNISNNVIAANKSGVYSTGNYNTYVGNTVNVTGADTTVHGMDFVSSVGNVINDSTIYTTGDGVHGIYFRLDTDDNTISNVNITTTGTSSHGIYFYSDSGQHPDGNVFSNIQLSTSGDDVYFSAQASNNKNYITNSSIIASEVTSDSGILYIQEWVKVNVTNSTGDVLVGANVTAYRNDSTLWWSRLTGDDGYTPLTAMVYLAIYNSNLYYYSPSLISVNNTGYQSNSTNINITKISTIPVVLRPLGLLSVSSDTFTAGLTYNGSSYGACSDTSTYRVAQNVTIHNATRKFVEFFALFNESDVNFSSLKVTPTETTVVVNTTGVTGVAAAHTLFLPQSKPILYVCPHANSTEQVNSTCADIVEFTYAEAQAGTTKSGLTVSLEDGYWRVDNITGSGMGEAQCTGTSPPASGDWTIADTTVCVNGLLNISGNITIANDANLTLDNVTLVLNTSNSQRRIINNSGTFVANYTNFTVMNASLNSGEQFSFVTEENGSLFIYNSYMTHIGEATRSKSPLFDRGIYVTGSNSEFRNVTITTANISNAEGIRVVDCVNITIESSTITVWTGSGSGRAIYFEDVNNSVIKNTTLSTSTGANLIYVSNGYNTTIFNNTGNNGNYGVYASGYDHNVSSNVMLGATTAYYISNNLHTVVDNYANATKGLHFSGAYFINVTNNVFHTDPVDGYGITFGESSANITIENTRVHTTGTKAYALHIDPDIMLIDNITVMNSNLTADNASDIYIGASSGVRSTYHLLNTSFNQTNVTFEDAATNELNVSWWMRAYVSSVVLDPEVGADVSVRDNASDVLWSDVIDASGYTSWHKTTEYMHNATAKYYKTNYTFNASKFPGGNISYPYNVTQSATVILTLVNIIPSISFVELNSSLETNYTWENLTLYISGASDNNNDNVKNITNWYINNRSLMVLNLPFDGESNATYTKDYALGNNGTVSSATYNSTGGYDGFGSYIFDGNSSTISVPDDSTLDLNTSFTISTWIKPISYPRTSARVLMKGGHNGTVVNYSLVNTDVTFYGIVADDESGYRVGSGDFNNDGVDDLVIGAWFADGGSDRKGETYVIFGPIKSSGEISLADANVTYYGSSNYDISGSAVGSGDFNNDGVDDLVIGARSAEGAGGTLSVEGETYVMFGPISSSGQVSLADADVVYYGITAGDTSGEAACGGDFNNDGIDDLVIGAPLAEGAGGTSDEEGETYVMFGPIPASGEVGLADADVTYYGISTNDYSGMSVGSGDFNNDGIDDLVIGAPRAEGAGGTSNDEGETYVMFGPISSSGQVSLADADVVYYGITADDESGSAVGSGDFNNDGIDDLVIGANRAEGPGGLSDGETYIFFGPINYSGEVNVSVANVTYYGMYADQSGMGVGSGDFNNDGVDDLVIGAHQAEGAGGTTDREGETYVIFGPTQLINNYDLFLDNASVVFSVENKSLKSTAKLPLNTFTHVAATYDGSSLNIYIDGEQNATTTFTDTLFTNTFDLTIGSFTEGFGSTFNGTIDEVSIYNRSLSAAQIKALYENKTNVIVSDETTAGENWYACVTPNDAVDEGTTLCTNNVTIVADDINPSVTNVTPQNNAIYNVSDVIPIGANVTDLDEISHVYANITIPNGTTINVTLTLTPGTNTYNYTYTVPNQKGTYNITFYANDTSSNINATEKTNFTVYNRVPLIVNITDVGSLAVFENTVRMINFSVIVADNDSLSDVSNVNLTIFKLGEATRMNTSCTLHETITSVKGNYTCAVDLWWWDGPGTWNITAEAIDVHGNATGPVNSTFVVQAVTSIQIGPNNITWAQLTPGLWNQTATQAILINNSGNVNVSPAGFSINATDLIGQDDATFYVPAFNFSIGPNTVGDAECGLNTTANQTVNNTITYIGWANLTRGNYTYANGTAQEELYICLRQVPVTMNGVGFKPQSYVAAREWVIEVQ